MQALGIRLGVQPRDEDHLWDIDIDESVFPEEGESDRDFIYRRYFSRWQPEHDVHDLLLMRGLHRAQIAILLKLVHMDGVFDQYLTRFENTSKVAYGDWRRNFVRANRGCKKAAERRAYFCFLTMLEHEYLHEIEVLVKGVRGIAQHYHSETGLFVREVHQRNLATIVWQNGRSAGHIFVTTKLQKAETFSFDDVAEACGTASFKQEEINQILKMVSASLDFSVENIRSIVADVLEPDAEEVLRNNQSPDIKLRTKGVDAGEDHQAYLCEFCGSMFLETEDPHSGFCCKFGKMCRFQLNPLPALLMQELQLRRNDRDDTHDKRFPILVRPLNNYFSFSTLHTTGYDENVHRAINLNSGIPSTVFRICGRTTTFVPSNIRPTLNSYVIDGISPSMMPDALNEEFNLVEAVREMLVRKNPLASTFRMWDWDGFENFDVTIRGNEKASQPKEIAVLLHRPNCFLDVREFDVRFFSRDNTSDATRDTRLNIRYDDCRSEAFHYPLLHVYGETGWGRQNRVDPLSNHSCTMKDYLRYRFMSSDVIEVESSDIPIATARFADGMNVHQRDEYGLPEVVQLDLDYPSEYEPWLLSNNDPDHPLIISTSRFHQFGLLAQEYLVDGFSRAVEHDTSFVKGMQMKHGHSQKDYYLSSSFFGSPRFLREKKNDSLHIVNRKGMPLFFITLTCSKEWAEFRRVLTAGQEPSDSPVWTSRIFNAKLNVFLERLKNGSLFSNCRRGKKFAFGLRGGPGDKGYCIHVVEFQKRGLPHAHICFRPWNGKEYDAKIDNEDYSFIDEIACAVVPQSVEFLRKWGMVDSDGKIVPEMQDLPGFEKWGQDQYTLLMELVRRVEDYMMHKTCTDYCHNTKFVDKCRFFFPFDLRDTTGKNCDHVCVIPCLIPVLAGVDPITGILLFARFNECDRLVVPYNPWILMTFNCHCNVQVCCSRACIGYLYKYVFKGVDKAKVNFNRIDPETGEVISSSNEIDEYHDGRYLSAAEAAWRVMGYTVYSMTAKVDNIDCHLPGESKKDEGSSMIEKYLDRPQLPEFESLTLIDFYDKYICSTKDWDRKSWECELRPEHVTARGASTFFVSERREIDENYVRLTGVPHKLAEKFALRQLLMHEPCRNLPDLKDANESYMQAAVRKGLIVAGNEGILAFKEAVELHQTPHELRSFVSSLMLDGESFLPILHDELLSPEVDNVFALTADQHSWMTPDHRYMWIVDFLHHKVEEFADVDGSVYFGLPPKSSGDPFADMELDERTEHAINEERGKWNQYEEAAHLAAQLPKIAQNVKQNALFQLITSEMQSDRNEVFWHFCGGPAGTGKTFLAEAILHFARSKCMIAKASAATWLAAGNFADALSIHSLFGLGIDEGVDAKPCAPSFSREAVLKHARFIVLDELPFLKRETFEQIFTYLRDLKQQYPFGPLIVMACGDFRQLAPVMRGNPTPAQVFENGILSSPKWKSITQTLFTDLVRQCDDTEYGEFVQAIGDGRISEREFPIGTPQHLARIHELYGHDLSELHLENMNRSEFVGFSHHSFINSERDFIHHVFPDLNGAEESLSSARSILCSTNKQKDKWNQLVQSFRTAPSISLKADHTLKRGDLSESEMESFHGAQCPDSTLDLKIGDVLLVTATVTVETGGICNNSRVRLLGISNNKRVLRVQKIGSRQTFLLPRRWFRDLHSGEDGVFERCQFPVQLAYAMTVHKCQGQTMNFVGIDGSVPFFAHGQTYVATSRVKKRGDIAFFHPSATNVSCLNVVFHSFITQRLGNPSKRRRRPTAQDAFVRRQRPT